MLGKVPFSRAGEPTGRGVDIRLEFAQRMEA